MALSNAGDMVDRFRHTVKVEVRPQPPSSNRDNAFHAAYATVFAMDILLSWKFKHLANVRREGLLAEPSRAAGHPELLRLLSP